MKRKKILCVIGTRPQLIKHSVLLPQLQKAFDVATVNTGQHYMHALNGGLIDRLFSDKNIQAIDIDKSLPPAQRLGAMITALSQTIASTLPDAVLVYGDTDTTLAGVLAATKSNIPLIHVEAGERSFNKGMPEEQNRLVADALSDILFCASYHAIKNLDREHNRNKIIYSGDVMKDLLLATAKKYETPITPQPYFFCTLHRNYNQKNAVKIEALLHALQQLQGQVFFALHPATAQTVKDIGNTFANITFLPPQDYYRSIHFQKFAQAVITDSGGMQKEAYWLMRPCITIRTETEWTETQKGNWNQLVYEDLNNIAALLNAEKTAYNPELYGNGQAAAIICNHLKTLL